MVLRTKLPTIITAMVAVIAPTEAYAAAGWTDAQTVNQFIARENSLDIIMTGTSNPMSCPSTSWFRLPTTASNYQVIVATVMNAKAQGKSVELWVYQCDTDGASWILGAWLTN